MKNQIQFQKGYSLTEFLRDYRTEAQCRNALFQWRWPHGYACPRCGGHNHCMLERRTLYQCDHQHSLISRIIFAATKLPLTIWFLAIQLVTQAKTALSALSLHRQLVTVHPQRLDTQ